MHPDEFTTYEPSFPTYDDGFHSAGGYHFDLHDDYQVDPFLASYDNGTTDIQAIAIRHAREAAEQMAEQAMASIGESEQVAAHGWVQAVVRGAEPTYFAARAPAVIEGPTRWTLAQQLSTALAKELGYSLDDRDQDCWFRPGEREWKHMPTDRQRAYNAAYERFCYLVGRRLPADDPLSEAELHDADVHEQMLAAQRSMEKPSTALARVMRRLRAWRTQLH